MWVYANYEGGKEYANTKAAAMLASGFESPVGRRISKGVYEVVNKQTGEQKGCVGLVEKMAKDGWEV